MPHHSGGGSHGGGFHGSHSSRGSSRYATPRFSRVYYPGARRFRYYNSNGKAEYLYGATMPKRLTLLSAIGTLFMPVVISLIFLSFLSSMFLSSFYPPKPLTVDYDNDSEYVVDNLEIIDDDEEERLSDILEEFQDTTGICPVVVTMNSSDWQRYDTYLEDYAFDYYLDEFDDEKHFLIIYSEREENNYVYWQWEAIQGDDTDSILTTSKFDAFGNNIQDELDNDSVSVGRAFINAFSDFNKVVMDKDDSDKVDAVIFVPCFIMCAVFIIVPIISVVKQYKIGKRDYEEVDDDAERSFGEELNDTVENIKSAFTSFGDRDDDGNGTFLE